MDLWRGALVVAVLTLGWCAWARWVEGRAGGWYGAYPPDRVWARLRRRCLRRAGYRCQNCGRRGRLRLPGPLWRRVPGWVRTWLATHGAELHADHIVPLRRGGRNRVDNLACLCRACHEAKHHRRFTFGAPDRGAGTPRVAATR